MREVSWCVRVTGNAVSARTGDFPIASKTLSLLESDSAPPLPHRDKEFAAIISVSLCIAFVLVRP